MAHEQPLLSLFKGPAGVDLTPVHLLHRRHDGFVSIHRKHDGKFESIASIPADALDLYHDQLGELCDQDAYFSVNGMYRSGFNKSRFIEGVKSAHRNVQSLRWLTAAYSDLDCYSLGITDGQAVGAIIDAQDRDHIPPASLLTRSGRGVWAFWVLTEQGSAGPVQAWPEKIDLYCQVQAELQRRLADIGADAQARDAARITRLPGSMNSRSGTRVGYWVQADSDKRGYTYTLAQLAELLDVQVKPPTKRLAAAVSRLSARGRKGQRGRWLKARESFERLRQLRGCFRSGTRNVAVLIYSHILMRLGLEDGDRWDELAQLYRSLEQPHGDPYTRRELKATFAKRLDHPLTNRWIADSLHITPEEAQLLDHWPPASRFGTGPQVTESTASRAERREQRRDALRGIVAKHGAQLTLAELVELLAAQGIESVQATVRTDLKAIGAPANPRRWKRPPETPELFD